MLNKNRVSTIDATKDALKDTVKGLIVFGGTPLMLAALFDFSGLDNYFGFEMN